jgi:hypothetical protein
VDAYLTGDSANILSESEIRSILRENRELFEELSGRRLGNDELNSIAREVASAASSIVGFSDSRGSGNAGSREKERQIERVWVGAPAGVKAIRFLLQPKVWIALIGILVLNVLVLCFLCRRKIRRFFLFLGIPSLIGCAVTSALALLTPYLAEIVAGTIGISKGSARELISSFFIASAAVAVLCLFIGVVCLLASSVGKKKVAI